MQNEQVKFTGVVVALNEERRLKECLQSLAFCDQLLVIDLGSTDNCIKIATESGAEIHHHHRVPVVEQVWPFAVSLARNDWIIRADPDEVFPIDLVKDITNIIKEFSNVAMIRLPHQYYFVGRPLNFGFWGGAKLVFKAFNKNRIELQPYVHRSMYAKEGYCTKEITATPQNLIQHYWVDSFSELFKKHWRYAKLEGQSLYHSGHRFTWSKFLKTVLATLKYEFVNLETMRGGPISVFLSLFYVSYIAAGQMSLWIYQRRVSNS